MLLNAPSPSVLAVAAGLLLVSPSLALAAGQPGVTPARQGQMLARRQIPDEQKEIPAGCNLPREGCACNSEIPSELYCLQGSDPKCGGWELICRSGVMSFAPCLGCSDAVPVKEGGHGTYCANYAGGEGSGAGAAYGVD